MNSAIRSGLSGTRSRAKRYELRTYCLGLRPGITLTKALILAADLEDDELGRKLELRK